jgi:hypothetical protein
LIEDGCVAIQNGLIAAVGATAELQAAAIPAQNSSMRAAA